MTTIDSLLHSVQNLNNEEYSEFISKISQYNKQRQNQKQLNAASQFKYNDAVKFTNKNGASISGRIIKINKKTIKVQTELGTWNVSPTLLSHSN